MTEKRVVGCAANSVMQKLFLKSSSDVFWEVQFTMICALTFFPSSVTAVCSLMGCIEVPSCSNTPWTDKYSAKSEQKGTAGRTAAPFFRRMPLVRNSLCDGTNAFFKMVHPGWGWSESGRFFKAISCSNGIGVRGVWCPICFCRWMISEKLFCCSVIESASGPSYLAINPLR